MRSRDTILVFSATAWVTRPVTALPEVLFPISAQVPPAAVAGEDFTFTFSPETFSSSLSLSYSLEAAPEWLRLEELTRTLSGTPFDKDAGEFHVVLQASDIDGSTTLDVALVVLNQRSLSAREDIFITQLQRVGGFSPPSTLLLQPEAKFSIQLGPEIFESDAVTTYYYATSSDSTPLPAWIGFDPNTVSFSGTTPALLTSQSSPQTFSFGLSASQLPGFSEVSFNFQISVTNHVLAFDKSVHTFNALLGAEISIPPMISNLRRDGTSIDSSAVRGTSLNQPDWLTFDPHDLSLSGRTPEGANDTYFKLTVTDDQNNVAATEIQLLVVKSVNTSLAEIYLGVVAASRGSYFVYSFDEPQKGSLQPGIDMDLGLAESWLHYTPSNLTVYGFVPANLDATSIRITISFLQDDHVYRVEHLTILITNAVVSAPPSAVPGDTNSSSEPTSSDIGLVPVSPTTTESKNHNRALALMIVLPIIVIAALATLLGLLFLRRSRNRLLALPQSSSLDSGSARSSVLETSLRDSYGDNVVLAESRSASISGTGQAPSSPPPRIDLSWSTRQRPPNRLMPTIDRFDVDTPTTRSSWDDMLMEVDNPADYGYETRNGRAQEGQTELDDRTVFLRQGSDSTAKMSTMAVSNDDASDSVPPPPDQDPRSHRFNGRRASGLGHGTCPNGYTADIRRPTLRQVPLSPLSEAPVIRVDPEAQQLTQPDLTRGRTIVVNGSSKLGPTSQRPRPTRLSSTADSEYQYQAWVAESEPLPYRHQPCRTRSHSHSHSHSSKLSAQGGEWISESNSSRPSDWYRSHQAEVEDLGSYSCFREHQGSFPSLGSVPMSLSQGPSMRSHQSEQSGTHSLRFI